MTITEAAKASGREESTLRRAAIRGTLKAEKIGRDWLITPAALEDYVANAERRRPRQRPPATDTEGQS